MKLFKAMALILSAWNVLKLTNAEEASGLGLLCYSDWVCFVEQNIPHHRTHLIFFTSEIL